MFFKGSGEDLNAFANNLTNMTVSFWYNYSSDLDDDDEFLSKYNTTGNKRMFQFRYESTTDGFVYFFSDDGSSDSDAILTSGVGISDDTNWHMYTMTFNNSEVKTYKDGILNGTNTSSVSRLFGSNEPVVIGSHFDKSRNLSGMMDNVVVLPYTITESQVLNMFNRDHILSSDETLASETWQFNAIASDGTDYSTLNSVQFIVNVTAAAVVEFQNSAVIKILQQLGEI